VKQFSSLTGGGFDDEAYSSDYYLDWTPSNYLSSRPSNSLYYFGHFKNSGLID